MRFVAGQGAVAELYREDAAAPLEPVALSGRCCRLWRSKDAIGKMLPSMEQQRCHREEQPVGEAAEKPEGRG